MTYSAILGRVIRTQRELRKIDLTDMSKRLRRGAPARDARSEHGGQRDRRPRTHRGRDRAPRRASAVLTSSLDRSLASL